MIYIGGILLWSLKTARITTKQERKLASFYSSLKAIRCPALNNDLVNFMAEGFNHLIYEKGRRERNKNNQIMKFKLLPRARKIVEISTTYQEYDEGLI